MSKKISEKVTWVGKIDWSLKKFHGDEYSTDKGSSYNAYLVRDKKTVLIDTVWMPYDDEFVANLEREIDLKKIDYIIMNHSEVDHSGALPELMKKMPGTPIYCTKNGAKIIKAHYHQDWNFVEVKTGDVLDIGESKLVFVEAPMLHWPDSMLTYMTGENTLFSNDAFGQHYASELLYNDKVDQAELYHEAEKYYANILTPFSHLATKKIQEILGLNLPVDLICPSHGVIWKDNPLQIVHQYLKWADNYQENQITIIFDTMWGATEKMANAMAEGIHAADPNVTLKVLNLSKHDKNDIITEVFKSKAIMVGSSTINNGILHSVAGILEMMKGMKFKNKKATAFGSYGWSGEGVKILEEDLTAAGFQLIGSGMRTLWKPDTEALEIAKAFGAEFVKGL